MTRSILQESAVFLMFAPAAPICFTMCSKYEALFLLVKFVTLPPPVHPLALLSAPLGQPTAKLKVYKLPTTSKKTMQFDEKIKIKNLLNEHVLTIHCVITSPLTLPAQVHETTRAWHPTILQRTLEYNSHLCALNTQNSTESDVYEMQ